MAIPAENGVLGRLEEPDPEELEDSFLRYAGDVTASRAESTAYHLSGTPEKDGYKNLITMMVPVDRVRACARQHGVSVTELLGAAMMQAIADLQEPILKVGNEPGTYSLYIGIPFCPSRCSYCSFVSCNLDRDRKMVQPYVDCLCNEVEEIRRQADKAGLTLCSIYIGGGTPTSLSADQLRQLMGTVRQNFDLSKVVEYTVEAGRPDCTDAEKLAVIKEYGLSLIHI